MYEVQTDTRIAKIVLAGIALHAVAAFFAWFVWGGPGVLTVGGFGVVAAAAFFIWVLYFYTCPKCGARLVSGSAEVTNDDLVHHDCPGCKIRWNSGIAVGRVGDP